MLSVLTNHSSSEIQVLELHLDCSIMISALKILTQRGMLNLKSCFKNQTLQNNLLKRFKHRFQSISAMKRIYLTFLKPNQGKQRTQKALCHIYTVLMMSKILKSMALMTLNSSNFLKCTSSVVWGINIVNLKLRLIDLSQHTDAQCFSPLSKNIS